MAEPWLMFEDMSGDSVAVPFSRIAYVSQDQIYGVKHTVVRVETCEGLMELRTKIPIEKLLSGYPDPEGEITAFEN